MKRIIIAAIFCVTMGLSPVWAQTLSLDQTVQDFLSSSNWYGTAYPIYSPEIQNKWGGGAGMFYQITQWACAGIRGDYVNGSFYSVSATATLQLPIHPFKAAPNLSLTPFVLGGIGTPVAGGDKGGQAIAITGIGAEVGLWKSKSGKFKLGIVADREDWGGLGKQYRIGPLLSYSFN